MTRTPSTAMLAPVAACSSAGGRTRKLGNCNNTPTAIARQPQSGATLMAPTSWPTMEHQSAFPACLPARRKPPIVLKRRRKRCRRSALRTSEPHCATVLSAISSALRARRRQHIPDFEPSSHRGYGDCFKGCWKQKAKQADRHVNMNQVSILTAPIQKQSK